MAETGFDAGPKKLAASVGEFVGANEAYYAREFDKIQSATKFPWSWNTMAALAGPLWGPARGLWGFFWTFIVLELLALVQIGRGLWGDLGADKVARAEKLLERSSSLYEKGKIALQNGEPDAQGLITTAGNLKRAAARLMEQAELAAAEATTLLIIGLVVLVAVRSPLPDQPLQLALVGQPSGQPHPALIGSPRLAQRFGQALPVPVVADGDCHPLVVAIAGPDAMGRHGRRLAPVAVGHAVAAGGAAVNGEVQRGSTVQRPRGLYARQVHPLALAGATSVVERHQDRDRHVVSTRVIHERVAPAGRRQVGQARLERQAGHGLRDRSP